MRSISSVSPPTLQLSKHPQRLWYFITETKTHNSSALFSGSFTKVTLSVRVGCERLAMQAIILFFSSYCRKPNHQKHVWIVLRASVKLLSLTS